MVGHVDNGLGVCGGAIADVYAVVVFQLIGNNCCYVSGEVVVAVGALHGQLERTVVGLLSLIDLILPTRGTSVQAMAEVVLRKLDFLSVDVDLTVLNAVCITTDSSTKI